MVSLGYYIEGFWYEFVWVPCFIFSATQILKHWLSSENRQKLRALQKTTHPVNVLVSFIGIIIGWDARCVFGFCPVFYFPAIAVFFISCLLMISGISWYREIFHVNLAATKGPNALLHQLDEETMFKLPSISDRSFAIACILYTLFGSMSIFLMIVVDRMSFILILLLYIEIIAICTTYTTARGYKIADEFVKKAAERKNCSIAVQMQREMYKNKMISGLISGFVINISILACIAVLVYDWRVSLSGELIVSNPSNYRFSFLVAAFGTACQALTISQIITTWVPLKKVDITLPPKTKENSKMATTNSSLSDSKAVAIPKEQFPVGKRWNKSLVSFDKRSNLSEPMLMDGMKIHSVSLYQSDLHKSELSSASKSAITSPEYSGSKTTSS